MKVYGYDCETNKDFFKKGRLRMLQFYGEQNNKTMVLWRAKGTIAWEVIYVDILAAQNFLKKEGKEAAKKAIERTGKVLTQEQVAKFMSNPENGFIAHNGLFDFHASLEDFGVAANPAGDSFILGALIPSGPQYSRSLDNITRTRVDSEYDKNTWGKWEDWDWDQPQMPDEAILYGAFDAWASFHSEKVMREDFPKYANQAYQIELNLIEPLTSMRLRGVTVKEDKFQESLLEYKKRVEDLNKELCKLRGGPVRVGSTAEVCQWLFNERGNIPTVMTGTGKPSASEEALSLLTDPVVEKILACKKAQSVLSTLNKINTENTGDRVGEYRVFHPEFKPLSESYGSRIYTANPSVNQWPWPLRGCVVPTNVTDVFWFGDVSAFELMVLAYAAGEEDLIASYMKGHDIHRAVASKIFNVPESEITDEQREMSKVVEYATIYGSEGHSVSRQLNRPLNECKDLMAKFMDGMPKIKALRESIHNMALKTGMAVTTFGRYKRLNEAFSPHLGAREVAKRKAFSFFAQSGAADIMKIALAKLHKTLPIGCYLNFTVFDSFLIGMKDASQQGEVDAKVEEALAVEVKGRPWKFLLKTGNGANWLEAKKHATNLVGMN